MLTNSVTVWLKVKGEDVGGMLTEGVYNGEVTFTSGPRCVQFSAKFTAAVASTIPNP